MTSQQHRLWTLLLIPGSLFAIHEAHRRHCYITAVVAEIVVLAIVSKTRDELKGIPDANAIA